MNRPNLAVFVFASIAIVDILRTTRTTAAFTMNVVESGSDVVGTGSGTINLTGLSLQYQVGYAGGYEAGTDYFGGSYLGLGAPLTYGQYHYSAIPTSGNTMVGGPPSFGAGAGSFASYGNGAPVGIASQDPFYSSIDLPAGYVSNTYMSDTSTWQFQTLAGLGLTPGRYIYRWGIGDTTDSLTLNIGSAYVPEPSSLLVFGSVAGWGLRRRQSRIPYRAEIKREARSKGA